MLQAKVLMINNLLCQHFLLWISMDLYWKMQCNGQTILIHGLIDFHQDRLMGVHGFVTTS